MDGDGAQRGGRYWKIESNQSDRPADSKQRCLEASSHGSPSPGRRGTRQLLVVSLYESMKTVVSWHDHCRKRAGGMESLGGESNRSTRQASNRGEEDL